ncbi:helix-turn-helix transcriptional regulator [Mesobacillus maritimus]|uniref:Helix-turn-helix transcriptional regulator n=1 Tax=Mesobacillus maritimus TaxID=1643336 RepID=A0ABS7K6E0_9BACI|nr:helix-turn-helix transcriptional regulator [Mesobacillus maritimus]MBY0097849.1 helix-turn-helix transcriptional regulator [Mesobacillus maritimus]
MLSNRVAVYRAIKGWSQQNLADRVGVSRQTIMHIEKNKYTPSLALAFKIALAFEEDINTIFAYQEEE